MTQVEAEEVAEWKYPPPYDFYDMTADEEDLEELLSPEKRGSHTYSVRENEQLVGFFTFSLLEDHMMEIGLGLHPDWTGKGVGDQFVEEGLQYAISTWQVNGFVLAVALFNQRAIRVYERLGFKKVEEFQQPTNGSVYDFVKMSKQVTSM
ncbi:GNAT family N-acetyltransferase [Halobacillus fulvus]|nr:GNAT family N-acetyltransferase [Halobacillus fulvus]